MIGYEPLGARVDQFFCLGHLVTTIPVLIRFSMCEQELLSRCMVQCMEVLENIITKKNFSKVKC